MTNIELVKEYIAETTAQQGLISPYTSANTPKGASIAGPFGISSMFPNLDAVCQYELGNFEFVNPQGLYPRFGRSPIIKALEQRARDITGFETLIILPNEKSALACIEYVGKCFPEISWSSRVKVFPNSALQIIDFPNQESYKKGLEFWQHTGEITTARVALNILSEDILERNPREHNEAQRQAQINRLKSIIHKLYKISATNGVYINNSGMSAIFHAFRAIESLPNKNPEYEGKLVQFGFPYTDTFKILSKWSKDAELLADFSEENFDRLRELASLRQLKAVFCEVPCNPLICSPDIARLSRILRKHKIPLVVDDTLATPFNIDLLHYADVMVHSLTKFVSGRANVLGGALVINPYSPLKNTLKDALDKTNFDTISSQDLETLNINALGFKQRMKKINSNARILAKLLRQHPKIQWIGYPEGDSTQGNYEELRRRDGGYGGIVSIRLADPTKVDDFMTNLYTWKGPSLGAEKTIATLYTLFAHFYELSLTRQNGIGDYDIRFSVGTDKQELDLILKAVNKL